MVLLRNRTKWLENPSLEVLNQTPLVLWNQTTKDPRFIVLQLFRITIQQFDRSSFRLLKINRNSSVNRVEKLFFYHLLKVSYPSLAVGITFQSPKVHSRISLIRPSWKLEEKRRKQVKWKPTSKVHKTC
jgi:hypothetical protein